MDHIIDLSKEIFSKYQKAPVPIDKWLRKANNGQLLFVPDRGVLMYDTRHSSSGDTTHIWLCGTIAEYRRTGVMYSLLRFMLNDSNCQDVISAHVNRNKFPEMIAFMTKLGFQSKGPVLGKKLERFEVSKLQLLVFLSVVP